MVLRKRNPFKPGAAEPSDTVRSLSAKLHNLRTIIQRSKSSDGSGGGGSLSAGEDLDGPARGTRARTSNSSTDSDRAWAVEEVGLSGNAGRAEGGGDPGDRLAATETPAHLRAFKKNVFDRLTAERNKVRCYT